MKRSMLAAVAATLLAASAAHADVLYTYTSQPMIEDFGPSVGTTLDPMTISLDFNDDGSFIGWTVAQHDLGFFQGGRGDIYFKTDSVGNVQSWSVPLTDGKLRGADTTYLHPGGAGGGVEFDSLSDARKTPALQSYDSSSIGTWTMKGHLDNFTYDASAVPEPASLAMLALGGAVIALRRRKRA